MNRDDRRKRPPLYAFIFWKDPHNDALRQQ